MVEIAPELHVQLLALVDRLRVESADFVGQPGDAQLWYTRGYANGMLKALVELGDTELGGRVPDDEVQLAAHQVMAWGKAYRHGEQIGHRETFEITQ